MGALSAVSGFITQAVHFSDTLNAAMQAHARSKGRYHGSRQNGSHPRQADFIYMRNLKSDSVALPAPTKRHFA
jgi:hypothetical protein